MGKKGRGLETLTFEIFCYRSNYEGFLLHSVIEPNSVGIYMFKVNSRNTIARCKICSKLTIMTPERRRWRKCRLERYFKPRVKSC